MMKTAFKKLRQWLRPDRPVYCYYSIRLQKYLACQVVKTRKLDGKMLSGLILLDWLGDDLITPREFKKARAMKIRFFPQPLPRTFIPVFDAPRHRYPMSFYIWDIPIGWWPVFADPLEKRKLFSHLPSEQSYGRLTLEQQTGILDLRGKKSIIDISDSALDEIIIDSDVQYLSLCNSKVTIITDPRHGLLLDLLCLSSGGDFPRGMEDLTGLVLFQAEYVNLKAVADAFPNLRQLSINGECGQLTGLSALKKLPQLEYFICHDMYGYDGDGMPKPEEMPRLSYIWLDGFPAEAKKEIGKHWKAAGGVTLWLEKAKTREWVERNRDNPFRAWYFADEENVSAAQIRKAGDIYKQAKTRMAALSGFPQEERAAAYGKIVGDYIAAFNALQRQHPIESEDEVDEVFEALQSAVRLAPGEYDAAKLREIFDSGKKFSIIHTKE